ncbi:hypothetical protein QTP88_015977 [Uroleucon formosanum]
MQVKICLSSKYRDCISNRIATFALENNKQLKSGECFKFDSRVDTNNNTVVTKWHDNKVVYVISNYKGPLPVENVKRWFVAKKKKKVDVPRPASIKISHALLQCGKVLMPKRGRPLSLIHHQVKKVDLLLQDQLTLLDMMKLDIGQSES